MPAADAITKLLKESLPGLIAVYAFGSRMQGHATSESDLDLAVLVPGYADPVLLWQLTSDLAELAGCPVDLLDLRATSSVMQHQVLVHGQRLWAADYQADLFEAAALNDKLELDRARAGLLADIERQGTVYGR